MSHHDAAKLSMRAVVNIFTSKTGLSAKPKINQGTTDPVFHFFFGEKSPKEDPRFN